MAVIKKRLNQNEILTCLADKTGFTKKQIKQVLDEIIALTHAELKTCGVFVLPELGKFVLKDRAARAARNPHTGETIQVPAKKVLKFRISNPTKVAVLGAKTSPKAKAAKAAKKTKK